MTWFTSDSHFNHKNILEYEKEKRPFKTIEEMNEVLIDNWNSVVLPRDRVYHLGDFCLSKHSIELAARLNGRKRLILGNHDTHNIALYSPYFEKIYGVAQWHNCILTHIPIHPDSLGSRYFLNLHGHTHSKKVQRKIDHLYPYSLLEDDPNYFNVSVECNNLTPVHEEIIYERLRELE